MNRVSFTFPSSSPLVTESWIDIAERTAEWLGCKYQPIALDEDAMAAGLEDATWFSETATPDTNGIGRMAMAEKMHALGMKVVLTGSFLLGSHVARALVS